MNRVVFGLCIALIILVLLAVYRNSLIEKEKFVQKKNNSVNYNYTLPMADPDVSCQDSIKEKTFISVAEFMDGKRYKCY
jgi:hypothetical protein